jgi:hypothetical protein
MRTMMFIANMFRLRDNSGVCSYFVVVRLVKG